MKFKDGDYVKVIIRDITPNDIKNGTFYAHYCGLAGTVDRIYDKEICVCVDQQTLPEEMLKRHLDIQESIRRKWLNGLSGEARNRLGPDEKRFDLAYTILVQESDLEKAKPGEVKRASVKKARPLATPKPSSPEKAVSEAKAKPTKAVKVASAKPLKVTVPKTKAAAKVAVKQISKAAPKAVKGPSAKAAAPKTSAKPAAKPARSAAIKKGGAATESSDANGLTEAELSFLKEREKLLKGKK